MALKSVMSHCRLLFPMWTGTIHSLQNQVGRNGERNSQPHELEQQAQDAASLAIAGREKSIAVRVVHASVID
jgi:hypothetical protein